MTEKRTLTRTLMTAGVPTKTGRIYPEAVLRAMVAAVMPKVEGRTLMGTVSGGPEGRVQLADVTHIVVDLRLEGGSVAATVEFLPTPKGLALLRLLDAIYDDATTYMAHAGLVAEGVGTTKWVEENGEVREVVEGYELLTVSVSVPAHVTSVREENAELNELFERQHRRVQAATQLWREETAQWLTQPDLGDLVQWLMDRAELAQRMNANLLGQLSDVQKEALAAMHKYPPGSEGSKAFSAVFAMADVSSRTPSVLYVENQKLRAAIRAHAFDKSGSPEHDDLKLYKATGIDGDKNEGEPQ